MIGFCISNRFHNEFYQSISILLQKKIIYNNVQKSILYFINYISK